MPGRQAAADKPRQAQPPADHCPLTKLQPKLLLLSGWMDAFDDDDDDDDDGNDGGDDDEEEDDDDE